MLHALNAFPPITTADQVSFKTPRLYSFNRETNTQVLEDFPDTLDLKAALVEPVNDGLSQALATSIGRALGFWLRSFHTWSSMPDQSELRKHVWGNEPMRKLKYRITYDAFVKVVESFLDIPEGYQETLASVKEMATQEFDRAANDKEEDWGIIQGDFWSGK